MKKGFLIVLGILVLSCGQEKKPQPAGSAANLVPEPAKALQDAVIKYPDSAALRMTLVDRLDSLGAAEQALQQLNELIRKDSLNNIYWLRKASLQQTLHDTAGALRSYRYAIRIYPSPDAMLSAANLLAEKKDSTALRICREVDAMSPGHEYSAHAAFITGVYYARTGKSAKAMDYFEQTLLNDFHYMEAYMEKGFLLYDGGKTAAALKIFETATRVNARYADAWYWAGKCRERLQHAANALKAYQQAAALDPGLKEASAAVERLAAK
jgi:tetratricopeptide (TPR) repeat protein